MELISPHCLQNKVLVTSKITLHVTVSICDFLPLLTERNDNNVRCRFIVKLNINNYRCTCEEMTSAMMELWRKACQKFAVLASNFESHRYTVVLTNHSLHSLSIKSDYLFSYKDKLPIMSKKHLYFFLLPVKFLRIPRDFRQ